jgi:ElaB/YqjD/DUF883 family membrane-anchored ribosome-binding protein
MSKTPNSRSDNTSDNQSMSAKIDKQTEDLKQQAQQVKSEIKDQTQQVLDEAKQKGREIADQAQHKAEDMLGEQQHRLAGQIDGVASALQNTARQLDTDQEWLARGAEHAAQSLSSMAGAMRDKDFSTLVNELESYTRRQPAVVLGGAAVAGFLLSRFLKSSTRQEERNFRDNRYPNPNY